MEILLRCFYLLFYFLFLANFTVGIKIKENRLSFQLLPLQKQPNARLSQKCLSPKFFTRCSSKLTEKSSVHEKQEKAVLFSKMSRREAISFGALSTLFIQLFPRQPSIAAVEPNLVVDQAFKKVLEEDYQAACDLWDEYIDQNGNEVFSLNNRGNCLLALGLPEKALEDFSKAISIEKNSFSLRVNRAIVHNELKNYKQAVADYSSALMSKEDPLVYIARGNVRSQMKDERGQMEDYYSALKLAPYVIGYKKKLTRWPKEILPTLLPKKKSAFLGANQAIRLLIQIKPTSQRDTIKEGISSLNNFFTKAS